MTNALLVQIEFDFFIFNLFCSLFIHSFLQILAEYDQRKFEFLLQVFNDPKYLENITGLTQLHADTETADWENTESDEDDF